MKIAKRNTKLPTKHPNKRTISTSNEVRGFPENSGYAELLIRNMSHIAK